MPDPIYTLRQPLSEICEVPDKIISVYSLEQHVWENSNSETARKERKPELMTIEEFQLDPVRPFLTDILRNIAAPWKQERRDSPVGQGYWIQAEFGSGKSHLLCCLSALALGQKEAWDIVKRKEEESGRGKRESMYRFWEEGIESKSKGSKGILVVVKTLVGSGSGTIGMHDKGRPLAEYVIEAVKEQLFVELGKNISLYPAELLADRFIKEDMERYRKDLGKFLNDPNYFDDDEFESAEEFIKIIQQNLTPEYKRSCGNKLWRFYTEYLKVKPDLASETEETLKHMTEVVLEEGYSGILLVLDEVSLFMKNRDDDMRVEDEKTLVVLSNRIAKVYNLPIWTVCSAQQALESKMGVKNIIADDRLKLVKLLEDDKDYYDIVLARVRKIKQPSYIGNYFFHYKKGFSWPNSIGEDEFRQFFPFHKPAVEVLRAITYELTTARSAIHFMHQTLKHQLKANGNELIRLWELFDEAVQYEEDPSGVAAGLVAIKTKCEADYHAYETCRRQIDSLTKGLLKVHRDKGIKIIQTLFLYHIAKTRQQGITPEEIANSVLIERDADANPEENNQHYETITENLKKELRQIAQSFDEDKKPRFRFDPVITGVDPRAEFAKARDEAESNERMRHEAWDRLLEMDEWKVQTRQSTLDLTGGVRSIFREIASEAAGREIDVFWNGRQISGSIRMLSYAWMTDDSKQFPAVDSEATDHDFAIYIGKKTVAEERIVRLLGARKDRRVILWTPDELSTDEQDRLVSFAAYRKLVSDWQGKDTEDAVAVINWVSSALQTELGMIMQIVNNSYGRGRIDAHDNTGMPFIMAGDLTSVLSSVVERVLTGTYVSKDIKFDPPFEFRDEEGVKVINGIVRTGVIPRNSKPDKDVSAAQNFGYTLKIMKPGNAGADKKLDVTDNAYVCAMWEFADDKLEDHGQTMKLETLYKNFMGLGTGDTRDYGLTRRMVQIFLLCLVREGKLRISLSTKSGLAVNTLESSNLADIVFNARILESMTDVWKTAKPENWDILRPYAEKLLGEVIPDNLPDVKINEYRDKLNQLFANEKELAIKTAARARDLFEEIKIPNPYSKELEQIKSLYSVDVDSGNNIDMILYALKTAFGYLAYDNGVVNLEEVDDLAVCIGNYIDMQRFLEYEGSIRTAYRYCNITIGDESSLSELASAIAGMKTKLSKLDEYISSYGRLKLELIGSDDPTAADKGTIAALIREYTKLYHIMHDTVLNKTQKVHDQISEMANGDILGALAALDKVDALRPEVYSNTLAHLEDYGNGVFCCSSPSHAHVESMLRNGPVHDCDLTFINAQKYIEAAEKAADDALYMINDVFTRKIDVFQNTGVRKLLEQGKDEPLISKLLECDTNEALKEYLIKILQSEPKLPELINKYMKRIIVKKVRIADFKPINGTIQKNEIAGVTEEFRKYLEAQFDAEKDTEDTLPVLQLE